MLFPDTCGLDKDTKSGQGHSCDGDRAVADAATDSGEVDAAKGEYREVVNEHIDEILYAGRHDKRCIGPATSLLHRNCCRYH